MEELSIEQILLQMMAQFFSLEKTLDNPYIETLLLVKGTGDVVEPNDLEID